MTGAWRFSLLFLIVLVLSACTISTTPPAQVVNVASVAPGAYYVVPAPYVASSQRHRCRTRHVERERRVEQRDRDVDRKPDRVREPPRQRVTKRLKRKGKDKGVTKVARAARHR